jgi:outer membrane receptor protein involved in Fe transport
LHLTDRFDVTAGGRYAHDTQNFTQISGGVFNGGAITSVSGHSSEDTFTWMVNPRFHITDDAMVYARVATGFRPGGPNAAIPGVATPTTFQADKLINYEAGLKAALLDHRLTLDLSAFWIDWTNIQLTTRVGAFSYLGNGGKATSKGFELETAWYPAEPLRIGFNAAYTDASLDELTPGQFAATGYLVGYQLPNVPRWSGSATADYHWSLDNGWTARLGGGVRYVGEKYDNPVGLAAQTFVMPSYAMLDLNAAISTDRWTLKVFARNLTDKRAYSSGQIWIDADGVSQANQAAIVDPRTIGVGLDIAF